MKKQDKYLTKWRDIMLLAAQALKEKNFDDYDKHMNSANEIVLLMKEDEALTYECSNFGLTNFIFEDALPKLIKSNKNAVKEFITIVKEDKNLLNQFQFIKALEQYNPSLDSKSYVTESIELVQSKIDNKTIAESNKKIANIISKYDIKPEKYISQDKLSFYESCDFLLKNKKKLTNLVEINQNIKLVANYIEKNPMSIQENKESIIDAITNFDKKYSTLLNIHEKQMLKNIISKNDEVSKETFKELKESCLSLTNKLIETADDDDKEKLMEIKQQIKDIPYNSMTIIEDAKKLLNIRDVLIN